MNKRTPQTLRTIGIWATLWWGITCLWVLACVWQSRGIYANLSLFSTRGFTADWRKALHMAYSSTTWLQVALLVIVLGWIAGAITWLYELKKHHFSYKAALKDLFMTIRK